MSNSTIKPSEEAVDDGKNHYISTLEYIGSLKHLNLNLKCEVVHKGYKEEQLDQFENIVKAKFNIPKPSPVDCELGPWNDCNATCGTGMQSRIIVQEALYGGKECSTNLTTECNSGPCPIDCELSSWSNCDATCGTGMQSRFIVQEALYGGKECSKNRTSECNSGSCPTVHVFPSSDILNDQLCKNWIDYPGYNIPNPEDCQTYYACVLNPLRDYEAVLKNCPSTSAFDPRFGICNYLDYVPSCLTGSIHQNRC